MIWSLQILRFIAALLVVYIHAVRIAVTATGSGGLLPLDVQIVGRAGVDIFFVISGVIIARVAVGLTWQEFAWRRWCRVVPIYFLASIPAVVIEAKTGFGWRDVLATYLLWPATDVMTIPMLTVAWTLCFEVLFYAATALLLWRRNALLVLLGLFGAAMILRPAGPVFQFLGNPIIIEFLLGVGIAQLPKWPAARWGIVVGAATMLLAGPMGLAPDGEVLDVLAGTDIGWRVLVYGISAALIVYGTMQLNAGPSFWTGQGDASYAVYLTHLLILMALRPFWIAYPIAPDMVILLSMFACVLFGWAVHARIEKPLLNSLSRRPIKASGVRIPAH